MTGSVMTSDTVRVTLSSPYNTTLTCTMDYIVSPEQSFSLIDIACIIRLRNLEDIELSETHPGFAIIITCIISSFLNDVNISVNEVKTLFDIDKVEPKYMLFDLNDISQINNKITCPNEEINTTETEEEISEPENNNDT